MITGQVVQGDKLGRALGYPTANIEVDSRYKLIPADGIYAVTVTYENKEFKGMLYIGLRPTVNGTQRVIEVNLLISIKTSMATGLPFTFTNCSAVIRNLIVLKH